MGWVVARPARGAGFRSLWRRPAWVQWREKPPDRSHPPHHFSHLVDCAVGVGGYIYKDNDVDLVKITVKIFEPKYIGLDTYDVITMVLEVRDGATVAEVMDALDSIYPKQVVKKRSRNSDARHMDKWPLYRLSSVLRYSFERGRCGPDNSSLWRLTGPMHHVFLYTSNGALLL